MHIPVRMTVRVIKALVVPSMVEAPSDVNRK